MEYVNYGLDIINALLEFLKGIWSFLNTPLNNYTKDIPILNWVVDIMNGIANIVGLELTPLGLLTVTGIGLFLALKVVQLFKGD